MRPRVSVLLPVYNAAETLAATLQSLSEQTLTDYELVAVDDGSVDRSRDILMARAGNDDRLRILYQNHRGIIGALNRGLHSCRGEFIARMDADDLMHPDRLFLQVSLLESDARLSVVSCLVKMFSDRSVVGRGMEIYEKWLNGLIEHEEICREIFIESPIPHPTAMLRRKELLALGGYQDSGWAEDYDLWLRYHAKGKLFAKVPRVLHYWREHEGRATRVSRRYSLENFLRAKAHYLLHGPLRDRDALILWGAGMTGRRLSKHLIRAGCSPEAFVDVLSTKIGGRLRNIPIIGPGQLPGLWKKWHRPLIVVAVASRGARALIRRQMTHMSFREGRDFLFAA